MNCTMLFTTGYSLITDIVKSPVKKANIIVIVNSFVTTS